MKTTGIVRRIDDLGRVVIPKEVRRNMGIVEGDPVEFLTKGDSIVIRKYLVGCILCGGHKPTTKLYPEKEICADCVSIIVKNAENLRTELGVGD